MSRDLTLRNAVSRNLVGGEIVTSFTFSRLLGQRRKASGRRMKEWPVGEFSRCVGVSSLVYLVP